MQHISDVFPKHLFWDIDCDMLDIHNDKDIIIPRALIASTAATFQLDISKLESFYSSNEIIDELRATKERISNNICALVATRYHIQSFARFNK